ncbi:uncharacterized protein LOC131996825 [Stomoxys calcitrans]|uniref:uncharacterized protein LOC131996825 n=1 Tax=Stomoxys calcitrans TaxID=35570 RepID=UPI0027E2F613|nr:uncharacterized protein LOC131996825 [Stomoxys calcitrans]
MHLAKYSILILLLLAIKLCSGNDQATDSPSSLDNNINSNLNHQKGRRKSCPPAEVPKPTPTEAPEPPPTGLRTLETINDCLALSDGTFLVDGRHCRRYYICQKQRVERLRCSIDQWFDRDISKCMDRNLVTNCPSNRS